MNQKLKNRYAPLKWILIPVFIVFLVMGIEIMLSVYQFTRYKNEIKPYYVTPILRPLVRLFVKDDFVPRTLSMYEWPWDYKTDRARPGRYNNPIDPKHPPYTINSFGLRGQEFEIPKPKDLYRIAVYGGSSTFGSESVDEETYPARLQQIFRHRTGKKNIEVLNYGAHSKSLYWIAQQYFREVDTIDPDLIIINSIRNTFADSLQKWTPYSDIVTPQKAKLLKAHLFLTDNVLLYRFMRRTIEAVQLHFAIKRVVKTSSDKAIVADGVAPNVDPHFFEIQYPNVIEGIYTHAKARGIRLMMLIEPIRCPPGEGGYTCMWGRHENSVPKYYEAFRQAITKLLKKYPDIIVLDPVEEMIQAAEQASSSRAVFWDPVHLSPEGNLLLAELITDTLVHNNVDRDLVASVDK